VRLLDYSQSVAGGMLIGAGSATLLLLNGRIAGVSGILGNVVFEAFGEQGWRLAFVIGLVLPATSIPSWSRQRLPRRRPQAASRCSSRPRWRR